MAIVSALSPISLAQFFYASGKLVRRAQLLPADLEPPTLYDARCYRGG